VRFETVITLARTRTPSARHFWPDGLHVRGQWNNDKGGDSHLADKAELEFKVTEAEARAVCGALQLLTGNVVWGIHNLRKSRKLFGDLEKGCSVEASEDTSHQLIEGLRMLIDEKTARVRELRLINLDDQVGRYRRRRLRRIVKWLPRGGRCRRRF
jgi:hypothetical protein